MAQVAKTFGRLPSELVGLRDSAVAYDFNYAASIALRFLDPHPLIAVVNGLAAGLNGRSTVSEASSYPVTHFDSPNGVFIDPSMAVFQSI